MSLWKREPCITLPDGLKIHSLIKRHMPQALPGDQVPPEHQEVHSAWSLHKSSVHAYWSIWLCSQYDHCELQYYHDCTVVVFKKYIWVRSRNRGSLVTWFCYQMIAKPGNKIATVSWPEPYMKYIFMYIVFVNYIYQILLSLFFIIIFIFISLITMNTVSYTIYHTIYHIHIINTCIYYYIYEIQIYNIFIG